VLDIVKDASRRGAVGKNTWMPACAGMTWDG